MDITASISENSMQLADIWEDDVRVEDAADLRRAFKRLRLKDRRVLWMAYVEGKKSQEIAADLGVSADAARQRVSRAASRLRAALGKRDSRELP